MHTHKISSCCHCPGHVATVDRQQSSPTGQDLVASICQCNKIYFVARQGIYNKADAQSTPLVLQHLFPDTITPALQLQDAPQEKQPQYHPTGTKIFYMYSTPPQAKAGTKQQHLLQNCCEKVCMTHTQNSPTKACKRQTTNHRQTASTNQLTAGKSAPLPTRICITQPPSKQHAANA